MQTWPISPVSIASVALRAEHEKKVARVNDSIKQQSSNTIKNILEDIQTGQIINLYMGNLRLPLQVSKDYCCCCTMI